METVTRTTEELDHRERTINRLRETTGLRGKIDAMCCYCIYDPHQKGAWREQVANCTDKVCPLFEVRTKSARRKL